MIHSGDPLIGTKLGSYQIVEAVGAGGMARIYKGAHIELKRYAAIKVVNWGLQEDPEFTERFRREAQAIATLRHPNIVQIYDFGKYSSGYFMAMEFIDGEDVALLLRQHRKEHALLPGDQIIRVVQDVAAALDYAHQHGVVHRDIKPSNIMINHEGQSILTDFGLVMYQASQSQVTMGNTFGTPHYVAPEQAISSAAAVPASDIYSLGVILYEMVTGQLPFDDESPLSVALKHVSEVPTPPTVIKPELSRDVEGVILKALSKQPADRFATAGDMLSALEVAWAGVVTPASASRQTYGPILPVGVPPAAEVPNITLPNAAAIAPLLSTVKAGPADESESPSSKKHMALPGWLLLAAAVIIGVIMGASVFMLISNGGSSTDDSASPVSTSGAAAFAPPPATPSSTATPLPTATTTRIPELPTSTPIPTSTSSPTQMPTNTPAPTATPSPTQTLTPEPTFTATSTSTPVPQPTATLGGPLFLDQLRNKILFKTDRSGKVEIYRMDADGSNQSPLTRESWSVYTELESALPFSPNQQEQIVTRGEGQLDLWRANLVTGQELRVTSSGQAEYDAAWSPVDNRITYVSEETGNGDIYMLNLDGSAVVRLTDNVEDFDKHPTWSPDGTRIAFWSDMGFNKTRQIWVIDLKSRILTSLSDNPFNDWDPVWVP